MRYHSSLLVKISEHSAKVIFMALICLSPSLVQANSVKDFEQVIEKALNAYHTPGMSVGILYKGDIVLSKGFGLANIEKKHKVNDKTYFRLASTSKAFTAAAIGVLVEDGVVNWNDKVIQHLPNFQLYNPYVTYEFTILDLLTHRSGLGGGAGDSMIWPEPSGFSRQEVIENLKYLKAQKPFRSSYSYSNVLYITAGELVEKVSGMTFEKFVETRIYQPLKMECYAGDVPKKALKSSAMAYGHNDERGIYPIPRNSITKQGLMSSAAGGMVCNAESMLKWTKFLLDTYQQGRVDAEETLESGVKEVTDESLPFTYKTLSYMWSAHNILGVSELDEEWNNTFFRSYGLGWRLENLGRLKAISHTGTLSGYQAYLMLVPELELGVMILNNGSNSAARGSVMQTIVKSYMQKNNILDYDLANIDWIQQYNDYLEEREQRYIDNLDIPVASSDMIISNEQVVGIYEDKWFGQLIVKASDESNQSLRIHSARMSTLTGTLVPFQDASYKIVWDNQNAASDAFMHFSLNTKREITHAELHPFTNKQFNNHAYTDMLFIKVQEEDGDGD